MLPTLACNLRFLRRPPHYPARLLSAAAKPEWLQAHDAATPPCASHELSVRQRRMLYRARQRGFLELDIILGQWAAQHVPHMREGSQTMEQMEALLDAETPDVFKWVTKQVQPPPEFDTPILRNIQEFIFQGKSAN